MDGKSSNNFMASTRKKKVKNNFRRGDEGEKGLFVHSEWVSEVTS